MTHNVRHQHLIVRAEINKPPGAEDCDFLVQWMAQLIEKIEMKVMYGPVAKYCPVAGNRGMTGFAVIETSHCAFHAWDELDTALLEFDVYTCSQLNVQDVLDELQVFDPVKIEYKFLDREHGLKLVSEQIA